MNNERLDVLMAIFQTYDLLLNVSQTSNDEIMQELTHQNKEYLDKIIEQNKEIINLLKGIEKKIKNNIICY